jgi:hypothetical protein
VFSTAVLGKDHIDNTLRHQGWELA